MFSFELMINNVKSYWLSFIYNNKDEFMGNYAQRKIYR